MRRNTQYAIRRVIILVSGVWCLVSFLGCEAFTRKFTRKPKKDDLVKEELVLVPEEYKDVQMSNEELYRQYFLFWKSWQDELINALSVGSNYKKQIDCINEAIKNLINLRALLKEEGQKKLDAYIDQLKGLKDQISKDLYGNSIVGNRQNAELLKKRILKDFSYNKIKDYLI